MRTQFIMALFGALALAGTMGCRSVNPGNQPAAAGFASVQVNNVNEAQVRGAILEVFRIHGYKAFTSDEALLFQRDATTSERRKYVSLIEKTPAVVRVTVTLLPLSPTTFRIDCTASVTEHPGESVFEQDHPMARRDNGEFQRLLNQVAQRLPASP